MKTLDIIRRAGRNLTRAKMRTVLTSSAIAIGGFAILASLMLGEGVRQYIDRLISTNIDPNSVVLGKDESLFEAQIRIGNGSALREYNPNATSYYGQEYDTLTREDIEKLEKRTDIKDLMVTYSVSPKYTVFKGAGDKKYVASVSQRDHTLAQASSAGRSFAVGEKLKDDEAVLPEAFLETLGKTAEEMLNTKIVITVSQQPQEVGEEEIMRVFAEQGQAGVKALTEGKVLEQEFTIVSVSKKSPEQMTSNLVVQISHQAARELSEFSTVGTEMHQKYLMTQVTAVGKTPEQLKEDLRKDGYYAMTSKDMQSMIFTFVNILQYIVMSFGLLALLVSVFGIVNTQYISVLERTQQIGLMKALGASKRDVAKLFRYEAAWVGFLGGALGTVLAWVGAIILNPTISESIGLGESRLLIFQPQMALGVIALLIAVAIIAGYLPSRKAAKLDPIVALRTE